MDFRGQRDDPGLGGFWILNSLKYAILCFFVSPHDSKIVFKLNLGLDGTGTLHSPPLVCWRNWLTSLHCTLLPHTPHNPGSSALRLFCRTSGVPLLTRPSELYTRTPLIQGFPQLP